MRISRQAFAQNRERIVSAASELFRAHGYDGVNVAEILGAAGLTHGAFYGHFASKEALFAEACESALTQIAQRIDGSAGRRGMHDYIRAYLSEAHLDNAAQGCPVAALASEVARRPPVVREAYERGSRRLLASLQGLLPPELEPDRRLALASALLMMLSGCLALARAASDRGTALALLETATASADGLLAQALQAARPAAGAPRRAGRAGKAPPSVKR